ncbi:DUF3800 domain-containing protein [Candidatus Saccharibacteria bacterium]|nr:DUF3800 domain-containing protein [Candidatus Saccharibacteria bacterium]
MKNYYLFIDESGDPSLKSINHDFPIFALLGILISDKEYEKLNFEFDRIKIKYFGSKNVIFHSRDIRKCDGVFAKLFDLRTKESFYRALDDVMENTDYKIISSVIKKQEHIDRYGKLADDPYEIGLTFVLEKTLFELDELNGFANVMIESRGKNEDSNLAAKYNELMTRGSHQVISSRFMSRLSSRAEYRRKLDNDNGLQMADLCAYPTARHVLHPDQPYPAYDKISNKFRLSNHNRVEGYGIKIFP